MIENDNNEWSDVDHYDIDYLADVKTIKKRKEKQTYTFT